ncbi:MAG: hypothetical protein VKQ33_15955 [Candidatus Sericytochromatia bacterium]|nr:hypothetical protein [Candidatus Sericytochromatia bacterium]
MRDERVPRQRLPALAVFAVLTTALAVGAQAKAAGPETQRLLPLEAVRAMAAREGMVILAITAEAPRRLVVACGGTMTRDVFLKRASLVAYAAFQSYAAPVEVVFEHSQGRGAQRCRVRRSDLDAYLGRRLSRAEYQARLAYQQEGPGVRIPPPPSMPVPAPARPTAHLPGTAAAGLGSVAVRPAAPPTPGPGPAVTGSPAPAPTPSAAVSASPVPTPMAAVSASPVLTPAATVSASPVLTPAAAASASPVATAGATNQPVDRVSGDPSGVAPLRAPEAVPAREATRPSGLAGDWRVGYALGAGRAPLDAWVLEFNRPVLPSLDVRPGLWMIGAFTPSTLRGVAGATEGAAMSIDLLATSRRVVGPATPAFEGGLGARATLIQGSAGGIYPAAHLRVGARWHMMSASLRYPLLAPAGDPTAMWDVSLGLMWPDAGRRE